MAGTTSTTTNTGGSSITPTTPQTGWSQGQYTSTTGVQPGGNNYPAGISGVGVDGSGTAVGTVQNNQLVANQLQGLLATNSPYIQQAQLAGTQQANQRGLLNSSIAAGNSEQAAIQSALPIATNDANTYSGLQTTNLNNLSKAQTQAMSDNAQLGAASISASAQEAIADANNTGALQRQREDLAYTGEQAGLDRSFTQGATQQQYQNQLGLNDQQYQNQYGLANQAGQINYGTSSALASQQYYQNAGLSNQQYQQNLGLGSFNLGSSLLQNQQQFGNSLGIAGLSNPSLIGDPTALGGYTQFISNIFGTSGIIDSLFNTIPGLNWASNGNGGLSNGG